MTVERLDREAIRARAEFDAYHSADSLADEVVALLDATDALARELWDTAGLLYVKHDDTETYNRVLALLDRLGYGAGEGEG